MAELSSNADLLARSSDATGLLRALVLCLQCSERRFVEVHRGDYVVLERDGTLNLSCPACGTHGRHSLLRLNS